MQAKKSGDTSFIVLKRGEPIIQSLTEFVKQRRIKAGYFNAIGVVSRAEIAHYNLRQKKYHIRSFNQMLEIISLMGNVTRKGKDIVVHGHIALGTDKMALYGGHLREGITGVTCEIVFKEIKASIQRRFDKDTGLNLIYPVRSV